MPTYKNPWHKPAQPTLYGPAEYTTNATPTEHKGFLIYERVACGIWDIVKDGECKAQRAGMNGAIRWIDSENERLSHEVRFAYP